VAVIQEAWVSDVSTRRVDDLGQAMGLSGIGKSTVSKLCKDIDEGMNAFLDRPLIRRVATRYHRLAINFAASIYLVAAVV
jgi:transposase-like protein